ncbi:MAG: glycosyltransferase [Rhodobacteraceae bacterium]|nr:MAG: glycosyltransferase [Paracoccaceae bacterium]
MADVIRQIGSRILRLFGLQRRKWVEVEVNQRLKAIQKNGLGNQKKQALLGKGATNFEQPSRKMGILETYVYHREKYPVKDNMVIWESHGGTGMVCHPLALFREFIKRENFSNWEHVWVIEDAEERARLSAEYKSFPNVSFIARKSIKYAGKMAVAGIIVGNTSLPVYFAKREEQYIVNTWHSLTVKKLGYDQPNGAVISRNIIRSLLSTDLLLSPNQWMTSIFMNSYKQKNIFHGSIMENCNPRVSLLDVPFAEVRMRLASRGILVQSDKPILLYAPTWRDTTTLDDEVERLTHVLEVLKKHAEPLGYQILIKPHHVTFTHLSSSNVEMSNFVPPTIDVNLILGATAILVTDYSSVFYEFLHKKRPILFYIPDLDFYSSDRGLYLSVDDLPGPATKDINEIVNWISDPKKFCDPFSGVAKNMLEESSVGDASISCKAVIDYVFGAARASTFKRNTKRPMLPAPIKMHNIMGGNKKNVIIYGGHFRRNGVLTSLITLLNKADFSTHDYTIFFMNPSTDDKAQIELIEETMQRLPSEVRVIIRIGQRTLLHEEEIALKDAEGGFLEGASLMQNSALKSLSTREFKRCFGDAHFDVAIDYSGYGIFFPLVLISANIKKFIIWQHNDLAADLGNLNKRGAANLQNKTSAAGLMQLYKAADYMVSCTEEIMKVNRSYLSSSENFDRFVYIRNIVDVERVLAGADNTFASLKAPERPIYKVSADRSLHLREVSTVCEEMVYCDNSPFDGSGEALSVTEVTLPSKEDINFVTIGRYSPEKNHIALIEAFSKFNIDRRNSRLYIIGDGSLRREYEQVIARLQLCDRVILTGNLRNPFGLSSLCDCFIFPSLYEGMGLVVLEARLLGLAVICSRFLAVNSVTDADYNLLTGHSADALYAAMKDFADGKVVGEKQFSVDSKNEESVRKFKSLLS